jgi:hypothetical protein
VSKVRVKNYFLWLLAFSMALPMALGDDAISFGIGDFVELKIDPESVTLDGVDDRYQLLVDGKGRDGQLQDLTEHATFRSRDPEVISVTKGGVISALSDGSGVVVVSVAGLRRQIRVSSSGCSQTGALHFRNDILPVLGKLGCNSSACHAKAEGQGGFKLSVFAFDPVSDHAALTIEQRGRRVFLAAPEHSLFLQKATATIPHGGGKRLSKDSREYELLRHWVAAGADYGSPGAPQLVGVEVQPKERQLEMGGHQRLRLLAHYSNGQVTDVTRFGRFQTNNETIANVDKEGYVTVGEVPGQAAVMASYMGEIDTFQGLVPNSRELPQGAPWPEINFVDHHVNNHLRKLRIEPSRRCSDSEFLRRVYLDLIGTLPDTTEARTFLQDDRPEKRTLLVEELLRRPEYGDYWTMRWADLLRVDRGKLGTEGAYAFSQWIHQRISQNESLDDLARSLLTAEGALVDVPQAHFFKVAKTPEEAARAVSQVLLGVRIACAQCHHHPYDRWSQADYYGMVDFFASVTTHQTARGEAILEIGNNITRHPRTGDPIKAHPLGASEPMDYRDVQSRKVLADWTTSPENPWFARNMANRLWAHLLGRGIIEPVDDVRETNPASNAPLLDALANYLVEKQFDAQALIRLIVASETYQRTSRTTESNERDDSNYSHAMMKRLEAEVLFDMVCQTTGVGEKFYGMPAGYRAIQLWDSKIQHYFLKLFGRPLRETACTCERGTEPSIAQVLHLLNAPSIEAKINHEGGQIAKLAGTISDTDRLVDELYLTFFSRFPTNTERVQGVDYIENIVADQRVGTEDLAWSLMNSIEFIFNR